jgi:hypothetical protein
MNQESPDPVAQMILSNALEGIQEAKLRCEEAIEHLSRSEALAAIGALTGVKERARYAVNILQVLFQWQATRNKT